jgi:NitT/TauT family transport system substrate-binding protein
MRFRRPHRAPFAAIAAAATVLAVVAAGCGGDDPEPAATVGSGLEKPSITVGTLPVADLAQLKLAMDRGYFTAEGLTVKTQVLQGGAEAIPRLRSKNLDISAGAWVPFFQAQESGAVKLRAVADAFQSAEGTHVVLVPKDSDIRTAKDLAGKKIGVNVKRNLATLLIDSALRPQGVTLADENYVPVPFPNMEAALKSGSVDAVQAVEPFHTQLAKSLGARKVLELSAGETANFPVAGYVATEEFAQQNPKTIAAFQRAIAKAQALLTDEKLLAQVIPTYTRIPAAIAAELKFGLYPANLDAARLKRVSDIMVKYGYLKSPIDVNALMATR